MIPARIDGRAGPAAAEAAVGEEPSGEEGARRRHPTAHPWRADHGALAARLAAHLEARGWPVETAQAAARDAWWVATGR